MASRRTQAFRDLGYTVVSEGDGSPLAGYSTAAYTVFKRLLHGKASKTFMSPARSRKHRGGRS